MKLAMFGGTGGTGIEVARQGLMAGHSIRALTRSPRHKLPTDLDLVLGDVRDEAAVLQTIDGADAVISCLATPLGATFRAHGRIAALGMTKIIAAMRVQKVSKLTALSVFGAGESWDKLRAGARLLHSTVLKGELADKNAMEKVVEGSSLDWTLIRPVTLIDGPPERGGEFRYLLDALNAVDTSMNHEADRATACIPTGASASGRRRETRSDGRAQPRRA